MNDENSNTYNCYTDHDEFFTRDSQHEWAFVGCPTTSLYKSKMEDSGHIEFHKNAKISVLDEDTCTHNFIKRCSIEQTTDNNCKTALSVQCSRVFLVFKLGLTVFLYHSWDTIESYKEHTEDHQVDEDGFCSQVC